MQARKHATNLTLKLMADVTINLKWGYTWPYKKDRCPPIVLIKKELSLCLIILRTSIAFSNSSVLDVSCSLSRVFKAMVDAHIYIICT